jgi:rhamnosyltransferase
MTRADIEIVVRCKNEMPFARDTLNALRGFRILFVDDGSTDGSRECALDAGATLVEAAALSPDGYVPGRILNGAMRRTTGAVVAFVNADAIPRSPDAVERLVAACEAGAAAAYGAQLARSDAPAHLQADHRRAFPEARDARLPGFFSMAASAIRRDVWSVVPFDETLRYSEDVDWTRRIGALGHEVRYEPDARFEHSHTYDPRALFRRMRGEGAIDRHVLRAGRPSLFRDGLRPLAGALWRDARQGTFAPSTASLRVVAQAGRFVGRLRPETARIVPDRNADGGTCRDETPLPASVTQSLGEAVSLIRRSLGDGVLAIVAVGSIGGAEPSLTWNAGRAVPRNDADLVAVVSDRFQAVRWRSAAVHASEEATVAAGFPVDVAVVSRHEIAARAGRLLWVDAAIRGARVLWGDPSVLAPLAGLGATDVSHDEIRRSLVNRATGLALSRLELAAGRTSGEVEARHVAKAWLALGDARLLLCGNLPVRGSDRSALLRDLAVSAPWLAPLADAYARAIAWQASAAPAPIDAATFERERRELAVAFAAGARDLGTPRAGTQGMIDALTPHALADVSLVGRLGAGALAIARGQLAPSWRWNGGGLGHPRRALTQVSLELAFRPDWAACLEGAARLLCAGSTQPNDVARALARLREVAA